MADNRRQQYEFVQPPPEDTICPVCLDVVEDPHLVECCGHHYCHKCVERLRTCPLCRAKGIHAIRDRFFERSHLNVLQVRCCERAHGCPWTGQLSELKNHLTDCQWTEVGCPHQCGVLVQRRMLQEHTRECPKRPYTCEHCQLKATFVEITEQHWPVCGKFPVACPNNCSVGMVERTALPAHLEKCPERKVQCEFSHAGCQWEGVRKELESHLEERWRSHTTLLSNHYLLELHSQQKEIQSLQQKLKQQEERLTTVTQLTTSLSDEVHELRLAQEEEYSSDDDDSSSADACAVRYPSLVSNPYSFQIDRVSHKRSQNHLHHSPAFYLSNPGYRMQITVYLGGCGKGRGSHISVFARILRGDDDNKLKWPFRGRLTVRLVSQRFSDHEDAIVYGPTAGNDCSGRVLGSGVSSPWGIPRFVPHSDLRRYVHADKLTFELPYVAA